MEVMCDAEMGVGLQLPVQNCITPGDAPAETHAVITYCRVHHRSVIIYCRVHHQVAIILIVSVTFIPSQHSGTYGKEALKNLCIFQKTFLYICDMISLRFSQRSIKLNIPYFKDSLTIIIGEFSFVKPKSRSQILNPKSRGKGLGLGLTV